MKTNRTDGKIIPLVSVITVVFNNEKDIAATVESIINQNFDNYEYIVIDGGSKDSTLNILENYSDKIDYMISEPDKGIYDAMNKAVKIARGKWLIFMNSGDMFYSEDVLKKIFETQIPDDAAFIYGNHEIDYTGYKKFSRAGSINNLWKGLPFSHQAILSLTECHRIKPFDLHYVFGADFDFFSYCYSKEMKFHYIDLPVALIKAGGFSGKNAIISIIERWKISRKYFQTHGMHLFYFFFIINNIISEIAKKIFGPKLSEIIRKNKNWFNI
ncbi:MAG: glycosyltransferase [Candidatus Riflebacteria bacterium]|nr:glycosyltransferase [Candidatus Riflebacteria bacterium]